MSNLLALENFPPFNNPWFKKVAELINRLLNGEMNAIGTVTLVNGATQTVLSDNRIKPTSVVQLFAQTAHAAAVTGLWTDMTTVPVGNLSGGSVTINHSLIAFADCTFGYTVHT